MIFGLLLGIVAFAVLALVLRVPYPITLVLGGLGIGFVPGIPEIELDPDLVLLIFLPPLLYGAAFFTSLRDLRRNARPIALLSIGAVHGDHGRGRAGGPLRGRARLGPRVRPRRDRLAHRRRRPRRDHAAGGGAAAHGHDRRGREPDQRLDRPGALPARRRRGGHRLVLTARGERRVRPERRGRPRRRAGGRPHHPGAAPAHRRPAHRDHHLHPQRLRGLPPGRGAGLLGRDRRRDGRHLHGLAHAGADHRGDAAPGSVGVGDPHLPAQRHPVPADRAPAAGDHRGPRG